MATDWLPGNHEKLYEQGLLTKTYLEGNLGNFGIDGKSAAWINEVFKPALEKLSVAYLAWKKPSERTPANTADLKTAEKEFKPIYRKLYNAFLKENPNVTDSDLLKMGLPARVVNKQTPAPIPDTYPLLTAEPHGVRRVKLSFRQPDKNTTVKPYGVRGVVVRWAILPAAPANIEELANTTISTKTPCLLSFGESQRGKSFYAVAAWQNTREEIGGWSVIVHAIIP